MRAIPTKTRITSWDIGTQQIRPQIRNLKIGTKIKIRVGGISNE